MEKDEVKQHDSSQNSQQVVYDSELDGNQNSEQPNSNFMQNCFLNTNQQILLASRRFYKKDRWAKQIVETCLDTDFESTTIQLHFGLFATKINIINFQERYKQDKNTNLIGSGQFGNVYTCKFKDDVCALKMIKFDEQNFFYSLRKVYREYFVTLLASELKVGPKINDIFGYQIVFFQNFALFGMEYCGKISVKNHSTHSFNQLLNVLHSLHVVHLDIKPQNLAWSFQYKKQVLIDFGLATIITQKQGQKTKTLFAGSFAYCSAEMKKCFMLKSQSQVDLYKNDRYGMEKCQRQMMSDLFLNSIQPKDKFIKQSQDNLLSCYCFISRIKQAIYSSNYLLAYSLMSQCQILHKSCLYVLNKTIQNKFLPEDMIEAWYRLKKTFMERLVLKNFMLSKYDQTIVACMEKSKINNFWPHLLLSQKHFQQFDKWSNNQMWLERIYLLLNQTRNSNLRRQEFESRYTSIVQKIYNSLKFPHTQFLIKKTRAVLQFFLDKFKKFNKKTEILESISDNLTFFTGGQPVYEIRHFIFQNTSDPTQYFLQGLKYQLLKINFQTQINIGILDYLQQMKQKLLKVKGNSQLYSVGSISVRVVELLKNIDFKQGSVGQVLKQVKNNINQLEKLLQNENQHIVKIYKRIQKRVNYLYQCGVQKIQDQELSEYYRLTQDKTYTLQICGSVSLNNINAFLYYNKAYTNLKNQFKGYNINQLKQYISFQFQYSKGFVFGFDSFFLFRTNQLISQKKSLAFFIQKQQTKWIEKELGNFMKSYTQFYEHIRWIVFIMILLLTTKKNGKYFQQKSHQSQYFSQFDKFIQIFSKKYEQALAEDIQKQSLKLVIRAATPIKKCYFISRYSQEDIIKDIEDIYQEVKLKTDIKEGNQHIKNHLKYTFIYLIIAIYKQKIILGKGNNERIESIFIQFYNNNTDLNLLSSVGHCLELIIVIFNKNNQHEANFQLLQNYIKFELKRIKFGQLFRFYLKNTFLAIEKFIKITPEQKIVQFARKITSAQEKENLKLLMKNSIGCYFVFFLIFTYTQQKQKEVNRKYFYKIGKKLHQFYHETKNTLVTCYYSVLLKYKMVDNIRKRILISRELRRICQKTGKQVENKTIKIMMEKRAMKWPSAVQQATQDKMKTYFL